MVILGLSVIRGAKHPPHKHDFEFRTQSARYGKGEASALGVFLRPEQTNAFNLAECGCGGR
jgi:hypothetical protein